MSYSDLDAMDEGKFLQGFHLFLKNQLNLALNKDSHQEQSKKRIKEKTKTSLSRSK
jgi:hypothetical protein